MLCTLLMTAGCASRLAQLAQPRGGLARRHVVAIGGHQQPWTTVVPSATPATRLLSERLRSSLDDTVNALDGRYRPDGNGLTIRQGFTTLVVYAGTDHRRLTTIAAVDSVVFRFSRGTSAPSTHVAIARTGTSLRITSQHYELQYRAAGAVPDEPSAPSRTSR